MDSSCFGHGFERVQNFQRAAGGKISQPAQMHGQQRKYCERGDKGLGRGDADFRPGVHVNAAVGFARDGAADDVDDGQRLVPAALGLAQRGQRVGGFAGLRDDQQHGVFFERTIAVTKFVRELDLDRDLRQFLDQIFAHQRRVPARAAGGDDDAVNPRATRPPSGSGRRIGRWRLPCPRGRAGRFPRCAAARKFP